MNSSIVNSTQYGKSVRMGLTNICTISMVTDLKNLFDAGIGIYVNQDKDGEEWERPASLELIDPSGGEEFQLDSGIRIRGAASRSSSNPKHSFRFFSVLVMVGNSISRFLGTKVFLHSIR